ncbi:FAD/NAD(P)-binding domain-containing protein [Auricularia subglabra TFB-10046 SS5]|nr:FAD/NAD(P)-binding domain-containing protein [Auricularia subglabra TFB-10046 SS5]
MAGVEEVDVLVIGGGNAAFAAAVSAHEAGAPRVLLLEKAPSAALAGGDTFYTAGAFRIAHGGLQDLHAAGILDPASHPPADRIVLEPYTPQQFADDVRRLDGSGRADERLVSKLVDGSREIAMWMAGLGVGFELAFHRQAYEVGDPPKFVFWGGLALVTKNGGKGLVDAWLDIAKQRGIEIRYDSAATGLVLDEHGTVVGAKVGEKVIRATGGVVLAAGGYSASRQMRIQHLGPQWGPALVRGTPYNEGDALNFAVRDAGARVAGDWAGCHATCWDAHAPEGDRNLTNQYTKSGYPLGLMINANGERFVDEGADFRNMTYAKYGRAILDQPGGYAFQVWDGKTIPLLRKEEYGDDVVRKITANTVPELAHALEAEDLGAPDEFVHTVATYNASLISVDGAAFNPALKDGIGTQGLALPKTNWALPLDTPPFMAVKVTCGITFTFGGLAVDANTANVLSEKGGKPISGLYCTGEMLGNLWWNNYPGGSGLVAGAVFGRIAGREAALRTKK